MKRLRISKQATIHILGAAPASADNKVVDLEAERRRRQELELDDSGKYTVIFSQAVAKYDASHPELITGQDNPDLIEEVRDILSVEELARNGHRRIDAFIVQARELLHREYFWLPVRSAKVFYNVNPAGKQVEIESIYRASSFSRGPTKRMSNKNNFYRKLRAGLGIQHSLVYRLIFIFGFLGALLAYHLGRTSVERSLFPADTVFGGATQQTRTLLSVPQFFLQRSYSDHSSRAAANSVASNQNNMIYAIYFSVHPLSSRLLGPPNSLLLGLPALASRAQSQGDRARSSPITTTSTKVFRANKIGTKRHAERLPITSASLLTTR
jgi:hypothetical protein